jgi:hypothetical protein
MATSAAAQSIKTGIILQEPRSDTSLEVMEAIKAGKIKPAALQEYINFFG